MQPRFDFAAPCGETLGIFRLLFRSEAKQTMNRRFYVLLSLALAAIFAGACTTTNAPSNSAATTSTPATQNAAIPAELKPALDTINSDDLMRHIKTLSSDEFEGRGPGTPGEELSVKYITEQFQKLGLKPGNPDGTYTQKVPLVGIHARRPRPLSTRAARRLISSSRPTTSPSRAASCPSRKSRTPTSSSSATASSRPNTAGTTTRALT